MVKESPIKGGTLLGCLFRYVSIYLGDVNYLEIGIPSGSKMFNPLSPSLPRSSEGFERVVQEHPLPENYGVGSLTYKKFDLSGGFGIWESDTLFESSGERQN